MKEMDRRAGHERLCRFVKGKIATVAKAADIPRRTLRDHLLMETHSKYLERSRILSEEKEKSQLVERNECNNLDMALLKRAFVNLYFSFIFPATLSISVFGSKAG
jgi:hypothetical protein